MNSKDILSITESILLLGLGLFCMVWPTKIQQFAMKSKSVPKFNPFYNLIPTENLIIALRISGGIAILMSGLLLWVMLRHRG